MSSGNEIPIKIVKKPTGNVKIKIPNDDFYYGKKMD